MQIEGYNQLLDNKIVFMIRPIAIKKMRFEKKDAPRLPEVKVISDPIAVEREIGWKLQRTAHTMSTNILI